MRRHQGKNEIHFIFLFVLALGGGGGIGLPCGLESVQV
jgi:hypothetical protein